MVQQLNPSRQKIAENTLYGAKIASHAENTAKTGEKIIEETADAIGESLPRRLLKQYLSLTRLPYRLIY